MRIFKTISIQDRVDFAKNLSILLRSGIPINEALTALADQSNSRRFKTVVGKVRDDIENGTPLSKAFAKELKIFGVIFVSMIRAGEQSGTLQGNLQFLADWLSRNADLRREVGAATLYPKMVFGAALLLGGGLSVFILPMLVPLFTGLDVELPFITKALLAISLFVQQFWLLSIVLVAGLVGLVVYSNTVKPIRSAYHLMYLKMPFLGPLMKNYQLALITQLFGTLLKSGLTLNESVDIVSQAATNVHYQTALLRIKSASEKGTPLSSSMSEFPPLFPKIAINIVSVGEQSGTLVNSFEYLSDFYTKEVNMQTKKLPTIIEPLLLVFIAGIVGFVALAIIMPIYELTGSISR
jgi:type IV pilus assembly protein PilC